MVDCHSDRNDTSGKTSSECRFVADCANVSAAWKYVTMTFQCLPSARITLPFRSLDSISSDVASVSNESSVWSSSRCSPPRSDSTSRTIESPLPRMLPWHSKWLSVNRSVEHSQVSLSHSAKTFATTCLAARSLCPRPRPRLHLQWDAVPRRASRYSSSGCPAN